MNTKITSQAFQEFAEAAGAIMNPAIRDWRAQGGKVVGYFCSHVPTEVLMAAGLLPFRMRGTGSTGTELSDAFFSSINCSFPRHTFNLALKGEYDFLDGLVCISSCDHVRRVYDNWKHNLKTPFLTVMSLPKKVSDPQVEWYRQEVNILFDVTSRVTLRGGHRYVWGNAQARASQLSQIGPVETQDLRMQVGLAGVTFRPAQNLDGLGLLIHQGAASFEFWTGRKPSLAAMRAAVKT